MVAKKRSASDKPNKKLAAKPPMMAKGKMAVNPMMGPAAKSPTGPVGKQVGATTGKKRKRK